MIDTFALPEGWALLPLEDLVEIKGRIGWRGYTVDDLRNSGPLVIGATQISMSNELDFSSPVYLSQDKYDESPEIKIEIGDILVVKVGNTIGKVAIVDKDIGPATINPNVVVLKKPKINPFYIYSVLTSPYGRHFLISNSQASAQPAINQSSLKKFLVPTPPNGLDLKLSHPLKAIFDKIRLNKEMNETLEAMARAIFKEWFIDFGPVRAKAEGRRPFGMDDETAALFPDSFEESEVGMIPKGWRLGRLDEIADVIGGGTPSTAESSYYCEPTTGISWLSPKDLSGYSWKYISFGSTDVTESGLKNSSARMLPIGTVLFSSRAPIGYVAIAERELCTNQGFKSLIPKNGSNSEYLYYLAKANIELIESRASGSTFKEISGNGMKELPVILPAVKILDTFQRITTELSNLQKELRHETENLKTIRDLLLPKVISGELNIERFKNE